MNTEEKINQIIQKIENLEERIKNIEENNTNKFTRKEFLEKLSEIGFIRNLDHGYYNGETYYKLDSIRRGYIALNNNNIYSTKIDFYSTIENIMKDIEQRLEEYLEEFRSVFIHDVEVYSSEARLDNLIDDLKIIISFLPKSNQPQYSGILESHIEVYNKVLEKQKNETKTKGE